MTVLLGLAELGLWNAGVYLLSYWNPAGVLVWLLEKAALAERAHEDDSVDVGDDVDQDGDQGGEGERDPD
jgi:hypothetical protein